jgi:death-on-curing protein
VPQHRFLSLAEVLKLHRRLVEQHGGSRGLRDLTRLEAALAQPHATFDGRDLYPTLIDKAAMLGFALVADHPFIDGNKRVGHAASESVLMLNGFELVADVTESERTILAVAASKIDRESFTAWISAKVQPLLR